MESILNSLIESTKRNSQSVPYFFMFLLLFSTFFKSEFQEFIHLFSTFLKEILSHKSYQLIESFFLSTDKTFILFEFSIIIFFFYLISDILIQVANGYRLINATGIFLFPSGVLFTILLIQQKILIKQPNLIQLAETHIIPNDSLSILFLFAFLFFIVFYMLIFATPLVAIYQIIESSDIESIWKIIYFLIYTIVLLMLVKQLLSN